MCFKASASVRFSAVRGEAVAFTGHVTPRGKAELLVANGEVTVLAEVGGKALDGARYPELGPPVVRGDNVAFPALTDRGSEVYAYRRGKVGMMLATGSPCASGKITTVRRIGWGWMPNSRGVGAICSGSPPSF